jgi:hypothetical protein
LEAAKTSCPKNPNYDRCNQSRDSLSAESPVFITKTLEIQSRFLKNLGGNGIISE